MGRLGGDKKNQVLNREFAFLAVSKTPLGGGGPAPRMRAVICLFHFKVFQESVILLAKCLKAYNTVGFWWCSRSLKSADSMRAVIGLFHFKVFHESVILWADQLE